MDAKGFGIVIDLMFSRDIPVNPNVGSMHWNDLTVCSDSVHVGEILSPQSSPPVEVLFLKQEGIVEPSVDDGWESRRVGVQTLPLCREADEYCNLKG